MPAFKLIGSINDAKDNAVFFQKEIMNKNSTAYINFSKFSHWYYFEEEGIFAPSKFIGYKNTKSIGYAKIAVVGLGGETTKALDKFFVKLNNKHNKYAELKKRLDDIAKLYKKVISKKIKTEGGIYVEKQHTGRSVLEDIIDNSVFPEEFPEFIEGATKKIIVNAYERDPEARKRCLLKYGYGCTVCGLRLDEKYGEIGANFIHVHHIKPISSEKAAHNVDPVTDLRPVCPNCHAMLHTSTPPLSIEDLKKIIIFHHKNSG